MFALPALLCLALAAAAAPQILLDGATAHHRFDGMGALSAGATSRLLYEYPEPQRSDIVPITIISLILAFVATLYPSWRASRVNPAEALRYE